RQQGLDEDQARHDSIAAPAARRRRGRPGPAERLMTLSIRKLDAAAAGFQERLREALAWESISNAGVQETVAAILADVKARGDAAVLEYTRRFDALDAASMEALEIAPARMQASLENLPAAQARALRDAAER